MARGYFRISDILPLLPFWPFCLSGLTRIRLGFIVIAKGPQCIFGGRWMFSPKALLDRVNQGSGSQLSIARSHSPQRQRRRRRCFGLRSPRRCCHNRCSWPIRRWRDSWRLKGDCKETTFQCSMRLATEIWLDSTFRSVGARMPGICIHVTAE